MYYVLSEEKVVLRSKNMTKNTKINSQNNPYFKIIILFLFFCSGFAGLIYESIWTHYLKLIFGHAAYAQSLVLSIFMGGLAIGAYIASRWITKIKNPLLTYALIEFIIGAFALFFHDIFIFTQDTLFIQLAPNVNSSFIFTGIKWGVGVLLILPQSILLGTTFPIISSALLKLFPVSSGKNISLLYFNNSFGAAIGALISGFVLIQEFGLPGTILTAGLINISIAVIILIFIKKTSIIKNVERTASALLEKNKFYYLMLSTAFFTGVASFFYEIAWIRMLTLVLGATTHAFELMISAFILGLALGSLWIKKRIDNFKSPVTILAYIQLLMATFALLTLVFYGQLFHLMEYIFKVINRNEEAYGVYMLLKHVLSLIIMLPATFFAGMTLPLITNILYKKSNNEKVIGHVYASNTLGSIIGIIIAMNFLLPLTGTKGVVSLGGLIDLSIALTLFGYIYFKNTNNKKLRLQFIVSAVFSLVLFQTVYLSSTLSPITTSSGVFRSGIATHKKETKILFHKDGKLSTVNVIKTTDGHTVLSNNGKPDAGIRLHDSKAGPDEVTMILLGALPIAINPQIKTVANIGMGSGQTVQTLLSYNSISKVDSIEIEEAVIEALPIFSVYSQLARFDKRSNIIIDDAKSFFSSSKIKYDLIVSEPPNPWVNGVANLFTSEFYSQIKRKLSDKGILTQWLHLYEINVNTISSIMKALSKNFKDYALYNTDDGDIVILASDNYNLNQITEGFLQSKKASLLLKRINIESSDSLRARYIGNKKLLDPLFFDYPAIMSSDYYPRLSYKAEKSLFLNDTASSITSMHNFPIPVNKILMGKVDDLSLNTSNEIYFTKSKNIYIAKSILEELGKDKSFNKNYPQQLHYSLKLLTNQLFQCGKDKPDSNLVTDSAFQLVKATTPYLGKNDLVDLWNIIHNSPCYKKLPEYDKNWLSLHKAIATQNFGPALSISKTILKKYTFMSSKKLNEYLFAATLISAIKTDQLPFAKSFVQKYSSLLKIKSQDTSLSLRLLLTHLKKLSV